MESGHSDRWPVGPVTSTVCVLAFASVTGRGDARLVSRTLAPERALTDCAYGAAVNMTALHELAPYGALTGCAYGAAVNMTALHEA